MEAQTNLNEMDKLETLLIENGIDYKRIDQPANNKNAFDFHKIYGKIKNFQWDVICHHGSYGYENDLLEYSDTIEPDIIGYLRAEDVLKLLKNIDYRKGHWDAIYSIENYIKHVTEKYDPLEYN